MKRNFNTKYRQNVRMPYSDEDYYRFLKKPGLMAPVINNLALQKI